jgi:POT family proton-dependent oligopeptide transporter
MIRGSSFKWQVFRNEKRAFQQRRLGIFFCGGDDLFMTHRKTPSDLEGMPPGIAHIVGNEAAERFSFYGMKAVLAVFMVQYLHLMAGGEGARIGEAEATEKVHLFNGAVYLMPLLGALIADAFVGKYRTIVSLSLVYCAGHAALAAMGLTGDPRFWLMLGLCLIALGSGGIKPCVSAHVGDQFGPRNAHLLPRIFNWFYFSINIGAFLSMLLTPWLLEWHGPHWAFGVPGVLMALATWVFWLGRSRYAHVPAAGMGFVRELFMGGGIKIMVKLLPLYIFVAMFWALFDQTGSTWIFQSQEMDRNFLGFQWLPSQVQALNSVFVLICIPVFSYWLYPLIDRVWRLTPLRKIGLGLFFMTTSFVLVAEIQRWIDTGGRPNISWQILAFALLTVAEVMVSIVALEFAYTQAPRTMKSLVMCFYLGSVAVGNFFVAGVNHFIQIPDASIEQLEKVLGESGGGKKSGHVALVGYDGVSGTMDDMSVELIDGSVASLKIPGGEIYHQAADVISGLVSLHGGNFPAEGLMNQSISQMKDPWGNPLRVELLNSMRLRLISNGPDRKGGTKWDSGLIVELPEKPHIKSESWADWLRPAETWLERRKRELGIDDMAMHGKSGEELSRREFCGGQTRLRGAAYFWFFVWLMLGTSIAFIPYALWYRPKTQLQGE